MTPARAIVVFDGDCGLCNGFVAWLVRHDRDRRLLIAGSAGEAGRATLSAARRSAISRRATTVGLCFSASTSGVAPLAS